MIPEEGMLYMWENGLTKIKKDDRISISFNFNFMMNKGK